MNRLMTLTKYLLLTALATLCTANALGQSYYTLITNNAELEAGAKYLVVGYEDAAMNSPVALSEYYKVDPGGAYYRESVPVSIVDYTISTTHSTTKGGDRSTWKPYELVLGGTSGAWTLFDSINNGYLSPFRTWFIAWINWDYLHVNSSPQNWTINIASSGAADVTAQVNNYKIRYNPGLGSIYHIFSAYNGGNRDIFLYKKIEKTAITNVTSGTTWEVPAPSAGGTLKVFERSGTAWSEITEPNTVVGNQITIANAATRSCEALMLHYYRGAQLDSARMIRIPKMVSGNSTINGAAGTMTDEVCADCDIAVLNAAKLSSTSGTNKRFKNAFLLPGSKLDMATGTTWAINDIFFKSIDCQENSGDPIPNLYSDFPTASMALNCNFSTGGKLKYVRKIDATRYYFIAFPYAVNVADIRALNRSLGTLGSDWYLQRWNGSRRAHTRTDSGNWLQIAMGDQLQPNMGYIIGLKDGSPQTEVVFPMATSTYNADAAASITLVNYKKSGGGDDPYHDGWNVIGIPYFSKCSGTTSSCGLNFVVPVTGVDNQFTYLTPTMMAANPINPFVSYFVQANSSLSATFDVVSRQFVAAAVDDLNSDIQITYRSTTGSDYMNLILDDNENDGYHFGRDLAKWVGTGTHIPQVYMMQGGTKLAINAVDYASASNIPVVVYNQAVGAATFSVDGRGASSQLTSLILTDLQTGITTNLLTDDYSYLATAGSDATRFVLSAQRMPTGTTQTVGSDVVISAYNGVLRVEHLAIGTTIRIFDTLGRAVRTQAASANDMEFTDLPKGIYIVQTDNQQGGNGYKISL